MTWEAWHIWIVVGILLFIAEIFTVSFFLACLGVACLASAVASFYGMGLHMQIVVFCVSALTVFFGIRPFFMRYVYASGAGVRTNIEALIGATGMVSKRIDPSTGKGRVIARGDDWHGVSADGTPIEVGKKVVVTKVDGTKLYVRPE